MGTLILLEVIQKIAISILLVLSLIQILVVLHATLNLDVEMEHLKISGLTLKNVTSTIQIQFLTPIHVILIVNFNLDVEMVK